MNVFTGVDLLVDCPVSYDSLKVALESSLGVVRRRISIISDMANYPRRNDSDLVCVVTSTMGSFIPYCHCRQTGLKWSMATYQS